MGSSFGAGLSYAGHCSDGRASVTMHTLQDTYEYGFMTDERCRRCERSGRSAYVLDVP
jgi:hypothetical protein